MKKIVEKLKLSQTLLRCMPSSLYTPMKKTNKLKGRLYSIHRAEIYSTEMMPRVKARNTLR